MASRRSQPRHYLEPGASGTDTHRAVFNELLGDALRPGSEPFFVALGGTGSLRSHSPEMIDDGVVACGELLCRSSPFYAAAAILFDVPPTSKRRRVAEAIVAGA